MGRSDAKEPYWVRRLAVGCVFTLTSIRATSSPRRYDEQPIPSYLRHGRQPKRDRATAWFAVRKLTCCCRCAGTRWLALGHRAVGRDRGPPGSLAPSAGWLAGGRAGHGVGRWFSVHRLGRRRRAVRCSSGWLFSSMPSRGFAVAPARQQRQLAACRSQPELGQSSQTRYLVLGLARSR